MLENLKNFFKRMSKKEEALLPNSGDAAKERLHLVLMQDRANVSVDFLDLMKQEIIDVIKKYIDIDENDMDVRLTNQINEDGTNGAPALYANIPIVAIKQAENKNENINEISGNANIIKKQENKKIEVKKEEPKKEVIKKIEETEVKDEKKTEKKSTKKEVAKVDTETKTVKKTITSTKSTPTKATKETKKSSTSKK